jgi:DNA-binding transcriptional regulator YdaS (Cro superfamily)
MPTMIDQNPQTAALQRAIELAGGTQAALAARLGFTQQAVSEWVAAGRVSRHGAMLIEAATGIPRQELRPDLYLTPAADAA